MQVHFFLKGKDNILKKIYAFFKDSSNLSKLVKACMLGVLRRNIKDVNSLIPHSRRKSWVNTFHFFHLTWL